MLNCGFLSNEKEEYVIRRSKFFRVIKHCSPHEAMRQAYQAWELVALLLRGEVKFTFRNQQGVKCTACGTLANYARLFRQPYPNLPENQFIVFYDTLHRAWRAFHVTELVSIEN